MAWPPLYSAPTAAWPRGGAARAGKVRRPNLVKHGLPLYRYDDKLNVEEILHTQLTGVPPSQSPAVQWQAWGSNISATDLSVLVSE